MRGEGKKRRRSPVRWLGLLALSLASAAVGQTVAVTVEDGGFVLRCTHQGAERVVLRGVGYCARVGGVTSPLRLERPPWGAGAG